MIHMVLRLLAEELGQRGGEALYKMRSVRQRSVKRVNSRLF